MNQHLPEQSSDYITVEVAYALPSQQLILPIKVQPGCTAEEAVKLSGILNKFSDIDLAQQPLGVFGKAVKNNTPLKHLDRVEIYRALIADPKEVRRQRAADGKIMKKGGGDAPVETA